MKNLDRLFILLLIFVPLISAVVLAIALTSRKNVTPDESSAATPTPIYEILPVTPTTEIIPTTTFAMANPSTFPTTKPTTTQKPVVTASQQPEATTVVPTNTLTPTPTTIKEADIAIPNEEDKANQSDVSLIVLAAIIIAFTFGGLVAFGSMVRKGK